MKYKDFEMRPAKGNDPFKFELIKWNGDSCFVLAFFTFDKQECSWDMKAVGLRFLEYSEDSNLNKYILAYLQMAKYCLQSYEEED